MPEDERYNFLVNIACKVLVRHKGKILLTREPKEAGWMPGRWGLPGGKVLMNESLHGAIARKIKEEAGIECTVRCLHKIVEILMPEKNVYHFIFVADYMGLDDSVKEKFTGGLKWVDQKEWESMSEDALTEYYLKEVVGEFWQRPFMMAETQLIREQRTFEDKKIKEWMERAKI